MYLNMMLVSQRAYAICVVVYIFKALLLALLVRNALAVPSAPPFSAFPTPFPFSRSHFSVHHFPFRVCVSATFPTSVFRRSSSSLHWNPIYPAAPRTFGIFSAILGNSRFVLTHWQRSQMVFKVLGGPSAFW